MKVPKKMKNARSTVGAVKQAVTGADFAGHVPDSDCTTQFFGNREGVAR